MSANSKAWLVSLGLIPYGPAWDLQRRIVAARKAGALPDVLLLCEHPHVITLGRNGRNENLLASEHVLRQMGVEFHATDRGGDITYHGPGQLVAYPILNLAEIRRDLVWYVRQLEEIMIRASGDFGVAAERRTGRTGIWVPIADGGEEKLGAIGVHVSRWITSHGLAYNVTSDLRYFDLIVPCGISGSRATSLERILGRRIDVAKAGAHIAQHAGECFSRDFQPQSRQALETALEAFESPALASSF